MNINLFGHFMPLSIVASFIVALLTIYNAHRRLMVYTRKITNEQILFCDLINKLMKSAHINIIFHNIKLSRTVVLEFISIATNSI